MIAVKRYFVTVDNRRVHYRRSGAGPPVVLLHGSPANSEVMMQEITALAQDFTCFALDLPGFGSSDPLAGDPLTMADLADATAAAIKALGLSGTRLFGTHTGAAVGLELASRHPDVVGGVVLDGVPVFTREEADALFEGYFAPLVVDPLGGHLTATWMRFRDQFTWFPWLARSHLCLNAVDRPSPEAIELWVGMFYRACRHYKPAYRAACFYCEGAILAAETLSVQAVFMATEDDMLFAHLDRLPRMKIKHAILKLPSNFTAKLAAVADSLKTVPGIDIAPSEQNLTLAGEAPAVGFLETAGGRVLIRTFGAAAAQPVVLLHDAPGSGYSLIPLGRLLASRCRVILPDLPGCGDSTIEGSDAVDAAAAAIETMAQELGLGPLVLFCRGAGSTVASAVLERGSVPVARVFLDGVPLADADIAARIAPDLPLDATGSHWIAAWLMVRDGETSAPWFDGRIAAQRHVAGDYDAQSLHDRTFEIMKARATYFHLPRDAYARDPLPALAAIGPSATIVLSENSSLKYSAQAVIEALPDAETVSIKTEAELAQMIATFVC